MTERSTAVLFGSLAELAREHDDRVALDVGGDRTTFTDLLVESNASLARLRHLEGRRVAVTMPASRSWVASLAALDRLGASVYLLAPTTSAARLEELATKLGLEWLLRDGDAVPLDELVESRAPMHSTPGSVTLLTSGTTGEPKAVRHDWCSLQRPVRRDPRFHGTRWLLTNPPHLYAGLQVFLQCFLNGGTLVALRDGLGPSGICEAMLAARVQYVSATPSFWRRLLAFGSCERLTGLDLLQITLGGEPASAELLRDLRRLFPAARLSHVYATTELGRCFTVSDGHAGFPARFLEESPEPGVELRLVDRELQARSPNRVRRATSGPHAEVDDWIPTGDLVDIVGDRALFRGRKSDIINVGGNKVHPVEVEAALRQVEGVLDARVHPISSSLVGQMVAAEIVVRPGSDPEVVGREIAGHCARALQPYQRPRRVVFVPELRLSAANKVSRGETTT